MDKHNLVFSQEILMKWRGKKMLYLVYILIGLLIILAANYAITAFLAIHDWFENREKDQLSFGDAFKKYFVKNNNIPTKFSDLFS